MSPRSTLELEIERPAAGGRMIARHDGEIVLVSGAIPGERVRVELERSARQVKWARVTDVLTASPFRRASSGDPACGGLAYVHIAYDRQCALKSEVLVDAFRRIGKMTLAGAVDVVPSPEHGYRLRARLHVRGRRAGFFRENTHDLCDAGGTGQLTPPTLAAVDRLVSDLGRAAEDVDAVVVAENVAGDERALHIEPLPNARVGLDRAISTLPDGSTGLSIEIGTRFVVIAGNPRVVDRSDQLFTGDLPIAADVTWTRTAASFFQGNRFLTGELVKHVLRQATGERIADLYAGVGLFSVALAAAGAGVVAVESDHAGSADLVINARSWPARLTAIRGSVEQHVPQFRPGTFDVVVMDPPRTGASAEALQAIVRLQAERVVYVSCDPATLARDAAKLIEAGYQLGPIRAFDLFPNTAHIEAVAVFTRS